MEYGHSAAKIAPHSRSIARDFNAPPYQGRLAPREVPPGYHYVAERYTLNGSENLGYQPNTWRMQNQRYPEPNGQQGTQFQIGQLMNQVTDMVQRQFGLKPKNMVVSYKSHIQNGLIKSHYHQDLDYQILLSLLEQTQH